MSFNTCCVLNCFIRLDNLKGVPLHCFPNPTRDQERFQVWVRRIGGEVAKLEPSYVFNNRRICHKHFDPIYYNTKNRLSKIAVPSIGVLDNQLPITPMQSHKPPLGSLVPGVSVSSSNGVPDETTAIPDIANTSKHCSAPLSKVTALPKHVTISAPLSKVTALPRNVTISAPLSKVTALPRNVTISAPLSKVTALPRNVTISAPLSKVTALPRNVTISAPLSKVTALPRNVTISAARSRCSVSITPNERKLKETIRKLKRQVRRYKLTNKSLSERLNLANKVIQSGFLPP